MLEEDFEWQERIDEELERLASMRRNLRHFGSPENELIHDAGIGVLADYLDLKQVIDEQKKATGPYFYAKNTAKVEKGIDEVSSLLSESEIPERMVLTFPRYDGKSLGREHTTIVEKYASKIPEDNSQWLTSPFDD